jgi:Rad3-related DNA helicase
LARHPLLAPDLADLFGGVQPCTPDCWEQPGCFVTRARRLAREADLVVVNHALLLSDHDAEGALVGPYATLVVDEAHRLPQSALDANTVRLDHRRLDQLEELLGATRPRGQLPETPALLAVRLREHPDGARAGDGAEELGRAAGRCQRAYRAWWRQVGRDLAPGEGAAPGQRLRLPDKDVAFAGVSAATGELLEAAAQAATAAAALNQRAEALDELPADTMDLLLRCAQAGQLVRQLERDVRFVTADPSDRWVTWLDPGPRGQVRALGATPLDPGPLLRDFWQGRQLAPVATSATLAVGEDFGFMLAELGLSGRRPRAGVISVPSPFDWEEQTRCLACDDVPDPDHPEFGAAVIGILDDLRRRVGRQTLALFTSYRLLQEAAQGLRDQDEQAGLFRGDGRGELLVQTSRSSPSELRERFREGRGATLLGTATFWEGVDFPGESLEVVVVTKLPFLVPTDPWVQARCEQLRQAGQNPFQDFMVRDAVLRLRQGVGRLIRRRRDRGIIVLLDNRLRRKSYGATFLAALPAPVRWLPDREALITTIQSFLDR